MSAAFTTHRRGPLFEKSSSFDAPKPRRGLFNPGSVFGTLVLIAIVFGGLQCATIFSARGTLDTADPYFSEGMEGIGLDPKFLMNLEREVDEESVLARERAMQEPTMLPRKHLRPASSADMPVQFVLRQYDSPKFRLEPAHIPDDEPHEAEPVQQVPVQDALQQVEKVFEDLTGHHEPASQPEEQQEQPSPAEGAEVSHGNEGADDMDKVKEALVSFMNTARTLEHEDVVNLNEFFRDAFSKYFAAYENNHEDFDAARRELFGAILSSSDAPGALVWMLAHWDLNRMPAEWRDWTERNIANRPPVHTIVEVYRDAVDDPEVVKGIFDTVELYRTNNWDFSVGLDMTEVA